MTGHDQGPLGGGDETGGFFEGGRSDWRSVGRMQATA